MITLLWSFIGPRIGLLLGHMTLGGRVWLVCLILGSVGGAGAAWYVLSNHYARDRQAVLGAALAAKQTEIQQLQRRIADSAEIRDKLERRANHADQKYRHLLNNDTRCNAAVGVVRMLNLSADPDYRPEELPADRAAAASTVTGGRIAEAYRDCAIQYNQVRLELIKAWDAVE